MCLNGLWGRFLDRLIGWSADGCLLLHWRNFVVLLKENHCCCWLTCNWHWFPGRTERQRKGKERKEEKNVSRDSCEAPVSARDVRNVVRCASDVVRFHLYVPSHVCAVKVVVVHTAIYLTCVSFDCLHVGSFSLNPPPPSSNHNHHHHHHECS